MYFCRAFFIVFYTWGFIASPLCLCLFTYLKTTTKIKQKYLIPQKNSVIYIKLCSWVFSSKFPLLVFVSSTLRLPAQRVAVSFCFLLAMIWQGTRLQLQWASASLYIALFLLCCTIQVFFFNIHYMQTRPGGYKIPCKLIWKFNLYATNLYYYYLQLIGSSCISSKYFFQWITISA